MNEHFSSLTSVFFNVQPETEFKTQREERREDENEKWRG